MTVNAGENSDSPALQPAQLRKAVLAATVGTTIEWYDFFIYGTAAGLIFPKLFFPNSDHLTGSLEAFATFFVGFISRPLGAAFFGHFGDRIGRKATLVSTLLVMGIATFLIGFTPGYAVIGPWGAIILVLLRVLQGIGVGGEWGGSILIAMEWTRGDRHRGLVASWPQLGVPAGLFLSNLVILAMSAWSGPGFATWGWRVPFLLSIVLVGVGLWVRLGVVETPVFRRLLSARRVERAPILEAIRRHPREILLSALLRMAEQAPFYIFTAFVFSYGAGTLKLSRDLILTAVLAASCLSFITLPLAGHLSDRIGRRRTFLIGAAATGVFGFIYFALLDTGRPVAAFVAIVLSLIPTSVTYGPEAALIAEAFTPRLRYSGASLGYQLASIIAGGPAPLIATALIVAWHSGFAVAVYIAGCAAVSLAAASFMPDRTGEDVSAEYASTV